MSIWSLRKPAPLSASDLAPGVMSPIATSRLRLRPLRTVKCTYDLSCRAYYLRPLRKNAAVAIAACWRHPPRPRADQPRRLRRAALLVQSNLPSRSSRLGRPTRRSAPHQSTATRIIPCLQCFCPFPSSTVEDGRQAKTARRPNGEIASCPIPHSRVPALDRPYNIRVAGRRTAAHHRRAALLDAHIEVRPR